MEVLNISISRYSKNSHSDYVKFQTYKAQNLLLTDAKKAKYQINSSKENQFQMLKKSELSYEDFYKTL